MRRIGVLLSAKPAGGILFTAGPLSTTKAVKEAMLVDFGSRDKEFVQCVKDIRKGMLTVGNCPEQDWTAIPMQGSGTMGIEAVMQSIVPKKQNKVLVINNGAYGKRINDISRQLGYNTAMFESPEDEEINFGKLEGWLKENPDATNFAIVHCETSTGVFNPVEKVRPLVAKHCKNATVFVDSMSSLGGVEVNVPEVCDFTISSSNKCVQGVPGFSYVLAKRSELSKCEGQSTSFTLDIFKQWKGLEQNTQFNYTPPTHTMFAFRQALRELENEGGVPARSKKYRAISQQTLKGMQKLGFKTLIPPSSPTFSHIMTSYHSPKHPKWDFLKFYDLLQKRGFVLYPGKVIKIDTFRIGSIGDLTSENVTEMLAAAEEVLKEMGVPVPVPNQ